MMRVREEYYLRFRRQATPNELPGHPYDVYLRRLVHKVTNLILVHNVTDRRS
jgi:hypothetical protein